MGMHDWCLDGVGRLKSRILLDFARDYLYAGMYNFAEYTGMFFGLGCCGAIDVGMCRRVTGWIGSSYAIDPLDKGNF